MGTVLEALDRERNERVALKLAEEGGPRVERELEALKRLRHHGVVSVRDWFQNERGVPVLVLDLLPGSLHDRLREGPLPETEAIELTLDLASALGHTHAEGILHRDLKPANVLINAAGRPVLTDFGLAHLADARERLTRTGEILGTPGYLSPEQADGDLGKIGPGTDVYGLGATLFAMLTGEPPFKGRSTLDTLRAVLMDPPPRPSSLAPGVSRDLDALVLTCLAKEPEDRYASMGDVIEALEGIESEAPRSGSGSVAGLLAVAAVAAIVLVGAIAFRQPAATQTTEAATPPPEAATPPPEAPPSPLASPSPARRRGLPAAREAELRALLRSDPERLVRELRPLTVRQPREPVLWTILGLARRRLRSTEQAERALKDWQVAASLDPTELEPRLEQAQLLLEMGRNAEGLRVVREALKVAPNDLGARRLEVQLMTGQVPGGELAARHAENLELAESARLASGRGWRERGRILAYGTMSGAERRRRLEAAEASFTRAIEADPRDAQAFAERSNARWRLERTGDALRDARRAVELDRFETSGLYNAAKLLSHSREGMPEAVRLKLLRAQLLPWMASAWVDAGDLQVMVGDTFGAQRSFDRALRLQPKNWRALLQRGLTHASMGASEPALRDLRAAKAAAQTDKQRAEVERYLQSYRAQVEREGGR